MRIFAAVLGASLSALMLPATVLRADPITFHYDVTVYGRTDFTLPPSEWGAKPIQPITFPLTMSFDPEVTRTLHTTTSALVFFGFPHFSSVPLAGAGAPADIPSGGTFITNFGHEQGAYADGFVIAPEATTLRGPRLFAEGFNPPLPPLALGDAALFVAAMQRPDLRFFFFDYRLSWRDDAGNPLDHAVFAPNSAGFEGTAQFQPTPEPATLLMSGVFLGAAIARALRRRE